MRIDKKRLVSVMLYADLLDVFVPIFEHVSSIFDPLALHMEQVGQLES